MNGRPCLVEELESAFLPGDGPLPHVLRRPGRRSACVRLGAEPASLVFALDGSRELEQVVADARAAHGHDGPALLVRLLAELGERGFLRGVAAADIGDAPPAGLLTRVFRPRRWRWRRAPAAIERIYRRGGWLFVTRPAGAGFVVLAAAGLAAFVALIIRGGVSPLLVGGELGIGAACFLGGRAALVGFHELAHGLALQRFGHRVAGAGISLMAIFPYAYVDTSPAWLERRRRRLVVTAAGPLCDLVLGGTAAIAALLTHGIPSEIGYQLALAGYLAALLNLNPCLERDGYYLLADALQLPGLRGAALGELTRSLSGSQAPGPRADAAQAAPPARVYRASRRFTPLLWFGCAVVAWGVIGSGLMISSLWGGLSSLEAVVPRDLSLGLLLGLWLLLLTPTGLLVGRPLAQRARHRQREASPRRAAGAGTEPPAAAASTRDPDALSRDRSPIVRLARQVLDDASLRQRVRALGPPPQFEALGDRELRSSVAGVVLAAGGESLGLTHAIDVVTPAIGSAAHGVIADTNLSQLGALLGIHHSDTPSAPGLEQALGPADASKPEPLLYEPAGTTASTGGATAVSADASDAAASTVYDNALGTGLSLPPWPGDGVGQVGIAHWMAAGAKSAGLPGPLPVMAALVESNLDNNACCDLDSKGYFQMRESIWNIPPWTNYFEEPDLQLAWFIHQALDVREQAVAAGDPSFGDNSSEWGNWIADVENPAAQFRYRYQLRLSEAEGLLAQPDTASGSGSLVDVTTSDGDATAAGTGAADAGDTGAAGTATTPGTTQTVTVIETITPTPAGTDTTVTDTTTTADTTTAADTTDGRRHDHGRGHDHDRGHRYDTTPATTRDSTAGTEGSSPAGEPSFSAVQPAEHRDGDAGQRRADVHCGVSDGATPTPRPRRDARDGRMRRRRDAPGRVRPARPRPVHRDNARHGPPHRVRNAGHDRDAVAGGRLHVRDPQSGEHGEPRRGLLRHRRHPI